MSNDLVAAIDNFCEATYELCCVISETFNEVFKQLCEGIEAVIKEIEQLHEEPAEIEIKHDTAYISKINDWMIVFEILKIPIKNQIIKRKEKLPLEAT